MGGLGTEKSKQPTYDRSPSFRNRLSFAEGIGTGAARARQGQTGARRRPQGRGDGNGIGVPLTRLTCANQARGNHAKNCPVAANPYGGNGAEILEWPINPPKTRHGQTQRNQDSLLGLASAVPSPPVPLTPAAIHGPR